MIIAVDIGGTKTLVVAFDHLGKIISEVRFVTQSNSELFLKDLNKYLEPFNPSEVTALSIAAAGQINTEQGSIIFSPNLGWKNLKLREYLSTKFNCPIYIENDANIAGLGATHALQQVPPLSFYVTIGTGIGTGIIRNGIIDHLFSHAEGGHMMLEKDGKVIEWERFASGRAITTKYKHTAMDIKDPKQWQEIAENLAAGFRVIIPLFQPDIIIIGGGIGTHFQHFKKPLEDVLLKQIPSFIPIPPLVQAIDPEKAVIYGCYYHALTELHTSSAV